MNALMCVAEPQGISWETPVEVTTKGESLIETDLGGKQLLEQPEDQVQLKLTIEDFVLHKMLGKGSFGKVSIRRLRSPCCSSSCSYARQVVLAILAGCRIFR